MMDSFSSFFLEKNHTCYHKPRMFTGHIPVHLRTHSVPFARSQRSDHQIMDKEGQESPEGWGASSRRLAVIRGHLNGSGAGSSAPMSSSKAEVQRAFPRSRYGQLFMSIYGTNVRTNTSVQYVDSFQ